MGRRHRLDLRGQLFQLQADSTKLRRVDIGVDSGLAQGRRVEQGIQHHRDAGKDRLFDPLEGLVEAERSEAHTSELQSLMRISYAVFCLNKKSGATTSYTRTNLPYLLILHNNI